MEMIKVSALESIALEREYDELGIDVVSANESFFGNIKQGITKAATAVWEALIKFFKWILSFFTKKKTDELKEKAEKVKDLEEETPSKVPEEAVEQATADVKKTSNLREAPKVISKLDIAAKTLPKEQAIEKWVNSTVGALQMLMRMARSSGHGMNSDMLFAVNAWLRQDKITTVEVKVNTICSDLVSIQRNEPTDQNIQKLASDIEHLVFNSLGVTIKANNIKTAEQYDKYAADVLDTIADYKKAVINDEILENNGKVKSLVTGIIDAAQLKGTIELTAKTFNSASQDLEVIIEMNKMLVKANNGSAETSKILTKTGAIALKVSQLAVSYHKGYLDLLDRHLTDYEKFLKKINTKTA